MTDDELLEGFTSARMTPFRHRDHVRMTWIYLRRLGLDGALAAVSEGLRHFCIAHAHPEKYHETVTRLYVYVIHERVSAPGAAQDWESFAAANPDLFENWGEFVARYYSQELLDSQLARETFVPPDRLPLSHV